MFNKLIAYLLPTLLFVVFFFPVAQYTDWGSDYAHYLHQAKNIIDGIDQQDNGFIINSNCPEVSPQAYSMGFPLIASIVYYFKGFDVPSFVYMQTLLLALIGLILYCILIKKHHPLLAFVGAALIVYTPYTIWYRNMILSEYSYVLFQMLFLLVYWNGLSKKKWLWLGLLLGFAWSIRSTALCIPLAITLWELLKFLKYHKNVHLRKYFITCFQFYLPMMAVAFALYKLLNKVLFEVGNNVGFHLEVYQNSFGPDTMVNNFKYYLTQVYQNYFDYWHDPLYATIACVGFILLFIKGVSVVNGKYKLVIFLLLTQGLMIICFPFQQGMRYLFPLMPFVFMLMVFALQKIIATNKAKGLIYVLIIGAYAISSFKGIKQYNSFVGNAPTWSPETPDTKKGWAFINKNFSKKNVFVCAFPRVLCFYTKSKAFTPCVGDEQQIWTDITKYGATHIMTNTQIQQWVPTLNEFVAKNASHLDTVFNNQEMTILEIKSKL